MGAKAPAPAAVLSRNNVDSARERQRCRLADSCRASRVGDGSPGMPMTSERSQFTTGNAGPFWDVSDDMTTANVPRPAPSGPEERSRHGGRPRARDPHHRRAGGAQHSSGGPTGREGSPRSGLAGATPGATEPVGADPR